jgi:hypothetical protein
MMNLTHTLESARGVTFYTRNLLQNVTSLQLTFSRYLCPDTNNVRYNSDHDEQERTTRGSHG